MSANAMKPGHADEPHYAQSSSRPPQHRLSMRSDRSRSGAASSPAEEPNAVDCKDLDRSYGSQEVLKHLSWHVPNGCIYGLLGPSGCGKTTLLSTVMGLLKAHGGSVDVFGHPVTSPIGRSVGYMPQDTALHRYLTIDESLRYYGMLHGVSLLLLLLLFPLLLFHLASYLSCHC